jgi:hypothetical protein
MRAAHMSIEKALGTYSKGHDACRGKRSVRKYSPVH